MGLKFISLSNLINLLMKKQSKEIIDLTEELGLTNSEAISLVVEKLKVLELTPKRASGYSYTLVHNVFYGTSDDENILIALKAIKEDRKPSKTPEVAQAEMDYKKAKQNYLKAVAEAV